MVRAYFDSDNNFIYEGIDLSNLTLPNTVSGYSAFVLPTYHNAYVQHTEGSVLAVVDMGNIHSEETNPWDDTLPLLTAYGGAPQPINLKLPYIIEDDGTTVKWCKSKIALFMCVRREGDFVSGYKWRAAFLFYKGYRAYHTPTSGSIQYNGRGVYRDAAGTYYQSYATHGEWICKDYFSTREELVEWMQNLEIKFPTWKVYDNGYIQSVDYVHRNSQAGADMDAWLLSDEGWNMTESWNKPRSILDSINVYKVNNIQDSLKKSLWYTDGTSSIKFSNGLYSNPMECILSLHFIPFSGLWGSDSPIVVGIQHLLAYNGGQASTLSAPKMSNEYVEIDFGNKLIPRHFNDYRDYTEIQTEIYIPCIGWHSLNSEEVVGKNLGLKYRVNFLNGDLIALLTVDDNIIDSIPGNCIQTIPMSGRDMTNLIGAQRTANGNLMSIAAGVGTTALGIGAMAAGAPMGGAMVAGGLGAVANGLMNAQNVSNEVSKAQNQVQKSGSIGGTSGIMGYETPYIVRRLHESVMPTGWEDYIGVSSHTIAQVGTLTGFVKTSNFRYAGSGATEEERAEINSLMDGGVII